MNYVLTNGHLVNEGKIEVADLRIENGRIEKIAKQITPKPGDQLIDLSGKYVFPGMIDDQVHFREPGLTHKANIRTESRAAVAGGVTSFMEMPNTVPNALTQELLADKYEIAANSSLANYSFFMGASNENFEEVMKTNKQNVCGLKIFMGSSTGNMLVDQEDVLNRFFKETDMLIATHCEDEKTVRERLARFKEEFGENAPASAHPIIRNEEACYISSSMAVAMAKKWNTRLHILHITTEEELALFDSSTDSKNKRITSEACVHHLWFDASDYERLGDQIKCNPAVKEARHKKAIRAAVRNGAIDVIATDHAPHTWEEKSQGYWKAPAGLPLVQHPMLVLMDLVKEGEFTLELVAQKTAHSVADIFQIQDRGYLREGYWADLAIIDLEKPLKVEKSNLLYKCGWSPFEGHQFSSSISKTFVSGQLVYADGAIIEGNPGQRMLFNR